MTTQRLGGKYWQEQEFLRSLHSTAKSGKAPYPKTSSHLHEKYQIAVEKLEKHKSPGSDQTPAELIQAERESLLTAIFRLVNSV
jgi:hypothetical protein